MGSCERRARMAIKKARFRDGTGLHFMSASRLLDQSAMSLAALPCRGAALVEGAGPGVRSIFGGGVSWRMSAVRVHSW